jgi:hypothetical protein
MTEHFCGCAAPICSKHVMKRKGETAYVSNLIDRTVLCNIYMLSVTKRIYIYIYIYIIKESSLKYSILH